MRVALVGDVRRIVVVRTLRGFADGFVSVLLAEYLLDLGFSPLRVGVVITGTLVGSAALTLAVGLIGEPVAVSNAAARARARSCCCTGHRVSQRHRVSCRSS